MSVILPVSFPLFCALSSAVRAVVVCLSCHPIQCSVIPYPSASRPTSPVTDARGRFLDCSLILDPPIILASPSYMGQATRSECFGLNLPTFFFLFLFLSFNHSLTFCLVLYVKSCNLYVDYHSHPPFFVFPLRTSRLLVALFHFFSLFSFLFLFFRSDFCFLPSGSLPSPNPLAVNFLFFEVTSLFVD